MSPRPFSVDPAVLANIRPMADQDVAAVAALHHSAMGKSTWALLGKRFLEALYGALVNDDRFLGFVYMEDGEVSGFIAGSQDTDQMLSHTLRRAWPKLAMQSLPHILNPTVLRRLVETHRYTDLSGGEPMPESLFCSFKPALRGRRISGHINKVLFDELFARGHHHVKVTTEVDNKGANRQLTSWGFTDEGHFTFYGKEMVRYVLNLESSDRVEPISRHPAI